MNTSDRSALQRIQDWYARECNGDWEHSYGVKIETLDNPGWIVRIDLVETSLFNVSFSPTERGDSETGQDWLRLKTDGKVFTGAGGVGNLEEILHAFLSWAETRSKHGA